MVEKLADVWTTRDLPVLIEVARRVDSGDTMPGIAEVAASLEMPVEQVELAAAALKRRHLVDTFDSMGGPIAFTAIAGEAYFHAGLHPSSDDAVTALVEALRQAADQVEDPEEKSRLRRLADGVLGVSTDIIGAVLGAVTTKAIGM